MLTGVSQDASLDGSQMQKMFGLNRNQVRFRPALRSRSVLQAQNKSMPVQHQYRDREQSEAYNAHNSELLRL